jgi:hypothetical protein
VLAESKNRVFGREPDLREVGLALDADASQPGAVRIEGEAGFRKTTPWAVAVRLGHDGAGNEDASTTRR